MKGNRELVWLLTFGALTISTNVWAQKPSKDANLDYRNQISKWRQGLETDLKGEEGWLSVAGLFWLKEGEATIGSNPGSDIVLPRGSAAPNVGVVRLEGGRVTITTATGVRMTFNEKHVGVQEMKLDSDRVKIGGLTLLAIRRGDRIGIRLYDHNCKGLMEFKGLHWYPVDLKYRVHAQYFPYLVPNSMPITNVLGDTQPVSNPGYVVFKLGGKECRLEAQAAGTGFFFNFRDLTSGKTTYPAGRFLDASAPIKGEVILDFNQATNPPCAFTAFATCPLPPRSNYLDISIPAGEKTHHPVE